jgi:GGDEF domain-containing protein
VTVTTYAAKPMSYASTRRLVLAAGLGVLLLIAGVMFVRRVDTVEVVAVLLFIPVFLAFTFGHVIGGAIAGLLATAVYALLRNPAIDAVGGGRFAGILAGRGLAYLAFGLLGGWASQQLERSLEKLDVYDQVDDATGLFNARFLVQDTDLEMNRAGRYKTFFSVCMVELPAGPVDALPRRKRAALLRDLGGQLREAVRSVDRAVHARDGSVHRFAVVCPETASEGAQVFGARLAERIGAYVRSRGVALPDGELVWVAVTHPGDDADRLGALRAQFAAIDRSEHPEHPPAPGSA